MEANSGGDLKLSLLKSPEKLTGLNHFNNKRSREVKFKIKGITCASCSLSIESVLGELDGIESVLVSPLEGHTVVKYTPELLFAKTIKETIENAGFEVDGFPDQEIAVCRLRIKGMACTSCSESVEHALPAVNGVKTVAVGLALEEAKVHFDPNTTSVDQIMKAVENSGFGSDLISSGNDINKVHLKLEGIRHPGDVTII